MVDYNNVKLFNNIFSFMLGIIAIIIFLYFFNSNQIIIINK